MFSFQVSVQSVPARVQRTIGPVAALLALVALMPAARGATSTFTVANTTFPTTAVGKSTRQNVTLTVNSAVPISKISLAANFSEYTLGAITGCTIDGETVNAVGTVCTIPVTFAPAVPGSASVPAPISRSAPLLVTDVESGKPNGYSFALTGSATGAVFAFAPGYITSVVGNPSFAGGDGTPGCPGQTDARGDGCPATDAAIYPSSMAVDPAGNLYIADGAEKVIHRVDAVTQMISVYAGKFGVQGPSGSGGPATSAAFFNPDSIAIDLAGNVYLYDVGVGIWEVNAASQTATIIAGAGQYPVLQAITDGKPASQANFPDLGAMLADQAGNLYLSTYTTGSVYKIDAVTGLITAIVGNGTAAFPAKGVPGVAAGAQLDQLQGLAMDSKGNLYIADAGNAVVYRVDAAGNISAYAGTQATAADYNAGCTVDSGEWGPATSAFVGVPAAIALDAADNLYIGEPGSEGGESCPIRRVDATTGIIHDVAGDTTQTYAFLSGVGASETYLSPNLVAVDGAGNIFAGQQNIAAGVSKISPSQSALIFPKQSQFVTSTQLVTASNIGIGDNLTLSNYPFVIAPIPSTATPSPFTNAPLTASSPSDCSSGTLTPGGVCGILVAFDPTSNASVAATDTVEDDSLGVAGTANVIAITGSAYNGATASLAPDPIAFASQPVGTPTAATSVVFNIFLNPLMTIQSIAITGANASSFSLSTAASSPCAVGGTIPTGGGACNIGVIFDPASSGALSATLSISWLSAGVTYTLSEPITGTGAQAATAATPVITPSASATYNAPVAVQITDATASSTINYTTDGTTPTTSSTVYSAPFTVSNAATEVEAIASSSSDATSATATATYSIQPYLSFKPAAVGATASSAQTLTATFSFPLDTALTVTLARQAPEAGSSTPTAALHYGHDYTIGTLACTPNGAIQVCTIPVTFVPTLPGARKDALIVSSAGTPLATVMLGGIGNAPLALVQPGVVTNPESNFADYIYNSTVDENGTVYFLTGSANAVYSVDKAGTTTKLPITGVANPTAIAVDGAGTLYLAPNSDAGESYFITYNQQTGVQSNVSMVPPAPFQQCNTGYGPFYDFVGVAVDDLGDIYGLEWSCQEVIELKTDGTFVVSPVTPKMSGIASVAVDDAGTIFVSGYDINEITPTSQSQVNTTGAGTVVVDAAETLYATRYSADGYEVGELPASNYSAPQAGLDGGTSGEIVDPLGLSLASDGTLYAGNYSNLDKIDRSQGAIAFGEQQVGVASSVQSVQIYNGGNEPLTISNIRLDGASSGFAIQTGSNNECANSTVVGPGMLCQLPVTLTPPHAGSFTGSITFTTNSGNDSASTAVVALSGYVNGIYLTVSPDPVAFGNQVDGTTSAVMTATVTNNGLLYSAGVNGPSEVQSDGAFNPTLGACGSIQLAVGQSCTLNITFDPSLPQAYNDTVTFSAYSSGGGPDLTTTFAVTGTGTAAAAPGASLSPGTLAFGGLVVNTTSPALAATLTNNGSATLTGIQPTIGTGGGGAPDVRRAKPALSGNGGFAIVTTGANSCGTTLAAGASCNIWITFSPTTTGSQQATLSVADDASASPQTSTLTGTGVSFVSQVNTPEFAQGVSVYFTTAGTLNSIDVLTGGAANKDFTSTNGGSCAAGTAYTVGESCTVYVLFDPQYAGARNGAILLTDAGGTVLGTTYLPGTGNGPQIAYDPGVPINEPLTAGTQAGPGIAVDGAGNLYLNNTNQGTVVQIPWNGTSYGAAVTIGTEAAFSNAESIAVDGAGNVYVGTQQQNELLFKIPWTGSAWGFPTEIPIKGVSLYTAFGVAADYLGNLYLVDRTGAQLVEVPWTGSTYGTAVSIPVTGMTAPFGVAVDGSLNLYVADLGSNSVYELPWTGNGYGTQTTLPLTGLTALSGIAVGGTGDVYVAGTAGSNSDIVEIPFTDSGFGAQVTLAGSGSSTVAVDGAGNVYGNSGNGQRPTASISKIDLADAPSLTFASTNVGATSSDSPKTVTVMNIGNAGLYLAAQDANPVYPANFPINSNDQNLCQEDSTVAQGESCDVSVSFTPTTSGPLSGDIVLTDNDANVSGATQSIAVSGNGAATGKPTAVLNPPSVAFGDLTVGATSAPFSFTLSNAYGTATLTNIAISLGGANPSDFALTTGTQACGATLAAGSYCYIYVTFSPASATSFAATLTVTDDANTSPQMSTITGTGTPAAAPIAKLTSTLAFPNTTVGSTASAMTATLSNSGNATLNITSIALAGANPADFAIATGSNACGGTLAASASCNIYVTFTPASASSFAASLVVTDNASPATQSTSITGTGTTAPAPIAKLTQTLAFPNTTVGSTASAMTATLSNSGNATLNIGSIALAGANPADFAITTGANACGGTLAASASCNIYVTFTPASASSFAASLVVTDNASPTTQSTSITGTGTTAPAPIAKLTQTLAFPNTTVGSTASAMTATLSNSGNATLNIGSIALAGANPADFAITTGANACGSTLAASASCNIYVTFTPASASSFAASLVVTDNATPATQSTSLTGTGVAAAAPIATLTPSSLSFTATSGTTTASQSASLSNTGNAVLNMSSIAIGGSNASDFTITTGANACGTTLAAGSTCSIYVTFTPASVASFTATLSVTDNASGSPQSVSLTGTGTAPADFTISATPASQTIASGAAAAYTVTVGSTGGTFSSAVTLSATGLPPGATATFAPQQLTPGSSSATSTLTVQTANAQAAQTRTSFWPMAAPALAFVLLVPFRRWRKVWKGKWMMTVIGVVSLAAAFSAIGCGGGFALTSKAQTYTVTVTGASGADTHSTTVQITVQ